MLKNSFDDDIVSFENSEDHSNIVLSYILVAKIADLKDSMLVCSIRSIFAKLGELYT